MPCRSVVFAGDAPYLNPMTYRQMAGRSGRRGLDLRGDVVFFGLSASKVQRLIRANVPSMRVSDYVTATPLPPPPPSIGDGPTN